MFILVVTDTICRVTLPFVHIFNNFIRSSEWGLIFICLFFSQHDFISNSAIVVDFCRVFTDAVFFYLRLFRLAYVYTILHVFDWEDPVLDKNQLALNLAFIPVVRGL